MSVTAATMPKPETGTVLIVDDEEDTLQSYARMLRLEGRTVFTADNAEDGLREAERHHPDAVILDLRMPLMDGLAILQRLRGRRLAPLNAQEKRQGIHERHP